MEISSELLISLVKIVIGFGIIFLGVDTIISHGYEWLEKYYQEQKLAPVAIEKKIKGYTLVLILVLIVAAFSINWHRIVVLIPTPSQPTEIGKGGDQPPGTQNPAQDTQKPATEVIATPTLNPPKEPGSASPTDLPIFTPTPTFTFTPTPTPIPGPRVIASRTTNYELDTLPSIWNATSIDALITSGQYNKSYSITVIPYEQFRWRFRWCTTSDDWMENNLELMSVTYWIDQVQLSESYIFEYESPSGDWVCHYWTTTLSEWESGSNIDLLISVDFYDDLNDGASIYLGGTYNLGLRVKVK